MSYKQKTIDFPIRKTRSFTKSIKSQRNIKNLNSELTQIQNKEKENDNVSFSANISPSKKRENENIDLEINKSPRKSSRKSQLKDKENIQVFEKSDIIKNALRSPLKSDENLPPLKNRLKSPFKSDENLPPLKNLLKSPFKSDENLPPLENSLKSPLKCEVILSPIKMSLRTPLKYNENSSPLKSSLRTSSSQMKKLLIDPLKEQTSPIKDPLSSPLKNVTLSNPLRSPLKNVTLSSINNSPSKSNIFSSPHKTIENLILSSPVRRSPRKLNFTNEISAKENSNKLDACKVYQSLKSSFAGSCGQLVGREDQLKKLKDYLEEHLRNSQPGSLYISGAPGTGKTASVTKIVEELKIPKLKTIFLNCMSKKSSKEIFSQINQYFSKTSSRTEREIIQNIEKHVTNSPNPIIMVLDEIDQLESKNQNVLYTIFEWPSLINSKLVLVGIANMLDLTDRILPRLQANQTYRPQLIHFSSYSKMEIVNIINERIKEANIGNTQIIKQTAIHFLAGKVAAVAGDIRKALDVCRRAVELCELDVKKQIRLNNGTENINLKQVDIPQVLSIFNEIYGSRVTSEIIDNPSAFPLQQKVLLCSLLLMLKHLKTKNINLGKFHEVYTRVCQRQKLPLIEQSEFFSLCSLLESRGLLQVKKAKELRGSKVFLRLNEEETEQALGDRVLLTTILQDKSCLSRVN